MFNQKQEIIEMKIELNEIKQDLTTVLKWQNQIIIDLQKNLKNLEEKFEKLEQFIFSPQYKK